jgi:hypothetical protein
MKTKSPTTTKARQVNDARKQAAEVGGALRRAAKDARNIARMHGTPVYVWENGKVVATKP